MKFRGGYMRGLFILLIMFSLFISGCELIEEKGFPQLSSIYYEEAQTFELPIDKIFRVTRFSICENAFDGTCGNPSGEDIVVANCSATYDLGCSGLCYVTPGAEVCGLYDSGLGNCYCIGDGICHDTFGEPITSEDCQECTPGETQSCSLPQVPGTCGECNSGLRTCNAEGQWGSCEQVVDPVQEICGNGQDDDCDCNPDGVDADCVYTPSICGNGIVEGMEECDLDLNSYEVAINYGDLGHFTNYDFSGACSSSEPCAACNACDLDIINDIETCVCADADGYVGDKILTNGNLDDVGTHEYGEVPENFCDYSDQSECDSYAPLCRWVSEGFCHGYMCMCVPPDYCGTPDSCYDAGCMWQEPYCEIDWDNGQDYIGEWYLPGFVLRSNLNQYVNNLFGGDWSEVHNYFIPNDFGGRYYDEEGNKIIDLTFLQDRIG